MFHAEIAAVVNALSRRNSEFKHALAEAVANEHRTNQQTIFNNLQAIVSALADNHESGRTDLRNQASCRVASDWVKTQKPEELPYI